MGTTFERLYAEESAGTMTKARMFERSMYRLQSTTGGVGTDWYWTTDGKVSGGAVLFTNYCPWVNVVMVDRSGRVSSSCAHGPIMVKEDRIEGDLYFYKWIVDSSRWKSFVYTGMGDGDGATFVSGSAGGRVFFASAIGQED